MNSLRNLYSRNFLKIKITGYLKINPKCMFSVSESPNVAEEKGNLLMPHYPNFVKELKKIAGSYDPLGAADHLERVLNYNISGGKKYRGQMVALAFEEIAPKAALTEANQTLSIYLGWCVELFHGTVMMIDDIMVGSVSRRGQPCWYKRNDVKMTAINDALVLDSATYDFLQKHFGSKKNYVNLIEAFHKNALVVNMGQHMDTATEHQDVMTFTAEQYRKIITYKTAHTYYLTAELAYHLAELDNPETLQSIRNILYDIGCFFQIQDDFLDCYGDPTRTGKLGMDIQDGKCTWLVTTFLSRANLVQKMALKKFYGKKDEESVQSVKKLYDNMSLREVYAKYEDETYIAIKKDIERTKGIPTKMCQNLIDKLYKRGI